MVKLSTIFADDIRILWETAEKASSSYDISVVFEDLDGFRITRESDDSPRYFFCDICKRTYRKTDRNDSRLCRKSDLNASWKALGMKIGLPYLFACDFGFSNFLIPIEIGGAVVGNVFGGQFAINRGIEKKATRRWTAENREIILKRWKEQEWEIPPAIGEQYKTALESFLKGPESGWGGDIDKFYDQINAEKIKRDVLEDVDIVDTKTYTDMRRAIYGLDLEQEIRSLLSICFDNSRFLTDKFEKLKAEGAQLPSPDVEEEVSDFLDRLKPDNPVQAESTGITDPIRRNDFIRRYYDDASFYKKSVNYRAKDLLTVLKIIEKLYSEAKILSQLGNERLYLNLYEGLASRIPPIINNECQMEMKWINNEMRNIIEAMGRQETKAPSLQLTEIKKLNANFFEVLSRFQEYQHKYSRTFWRRFVSFSMTNGDLVLSKFFSKYINSLAWYNYVGLNIDRCERIYVSVILELQSLRAQKKELGYELLDLTERRKGKERERIELEESDREQVDREVQGLNEKIEGKRKEIHKLDERINLIERANDTFLRASNECKKIHERFEKNLKDTRSFYERNIVRFLVRKDIAQLNLQAFGLDEMLRQLKMSCREMNTDLKILEETGQRPYEKNSILEDQYSIATINLKDKFIEGLIWVNNCLSKLMKMTHKKDFHVRFDTMYFNAGGLAPVHTYIEQAQEKWMIRRDESGAVSKETEKRIGKELGITRKYLSMLLGVEKEEIVLTDSTTEGLSLVLQAIRFKERDEIITSNAEHDVVRYLLSDMIKKYEDFYSLHISWNPKGYPEDDIPKQVTHRTRLVLISDILFTTGDRLKVKKLIKKCREKYVEETGKNKKDQSSDGILFLVDGAQSAGQTPLNLKDMNCDFFAMDGHKWLLASEGSGALYARRKFLEGKDPSVHFTFIKNYMVVDWKTGFHPKDKDGRSYELATINLPSKIGLQTAIRIIARDGFSQIIGAKQLDEEDINNIDKILDDCFDDVGETKKTDLAEPYPKGQETPEKTTFPRPIKLENGGQTLLVRTTGATETEQLLKECIDQGIREIKRKIDELKRYLRRRLLQLKEELERDENSKITIKVVTPEKNEGGVVGLQLINRRTGIPLDYSDEERALARTLNKHEYEKHESIGGTLESQYGIIFRVIPPPYPPAIRICLHKYNTPSEIDIMYQALLKTIPTLI